MTENKPNLLLLSHCVPDAVGGPQRVRAWQLARLLSCSHRVHLACVLDGPVHLSRWRALDQSVHRLAIEACPVAHHVIGRWVASVNPIAGKRLGYSRTLTKLLASWSKEIAFDTVACTDIALWPYVQKVGASSRILDLRRGVFSQPNPEGTSTRLRIGPSGTDRLRDRDRCIRTIANKCDLVTVGRHEDLYNLVADSKRVLMLPEAVDLAYLNTVDAGGQCESKQQQSPSKLVLHIDWSHRQSRQVYDWFSRKVWPKVRRAAPDTQLQQTRPGLAPNTLGMLQDACVVVSPGRDPELGRLPILQALAMKRAVVTSESAAEGLGTRHGEHLLATTNEDGWVKHCLTSLRSASLRLQLSRGGRRFVERHFPFEQAGRPLIQAMTRYSLPGSAVAKAA